MPVPDSLKRNVLLCLGVSLLALGVYGGIGWPLCVPLLALAGYDAWRKEARRRERGTWSLILWNFLAVGALAFFFFDAARLSRLTEASIHLMVFILCYFCTKRKQWGDLVKLLVLSFLLLLSAAALTNEVEFGLFLLVYLGAAIAALFQFALAPAEGTPAAPRLNRRLLRHLVLGYLPAVLLVGGALFVSLPRYEAGLLSYLATSPKPTAGFSRSVELGDIGRIKRNSRIVMSVRLPDGPPSPGPVRLRGIALDTFDGRSWSRRVTGRGVPRRLGPGVYGLGPIPDQSRVVRQEITLAPRMGDVLFALATPVQVRAGDLPGLDVDRHHSLYPIRMTPRSLEYEVDSVRGPYPFRELSPALRPVYLQLPPVPDRVRTLAREVAPPGQSPREQVRALARHLRRAYPYTLDVPDWNVQSPLTYFLLERNPGHCEYFATSLAVMARSLGIPSRLVNGFLLGAPSELTDSYLVRQDDAHSWVEVYLEGQGWVEVDPTPPVRRVAAGAWWQALRDRWDSTELLWDSYVAGFNYRYQAAVAEAVRGLLQAGAGRFRRLFPDGPAAPGDWWRTVILPVTVGGVAILGLWILGRTLRAALAPPASAASVWFLRRLERIGRRRGRPRHPAETPREWGRALGKTLEREAAVAELIRLYEQVRFGGRPLDRSREARARHLLTRVRAGEGR